MKHNKKQLVKQICDLSLRSILGGMAICLGTLASKLCPYPELSPLLFAVGIFLVMELDLGLITRHIPTYGLNKYIGSAIVLVSNIVVAYVCGIPFNLPLAVPEHLFFMSIGGGALIGLVSLVNLYGKKYKTLIMALIMYIFVMLGMPHCVVYAFLNVDFLTLLIVIAGNLIGGFSIGYLIHKSQGRKFLN